MSQRQAFIQMHRMRYRVVPLQGYHGQGKYAQFGAENAKKSRSLGINLKFKTLLFVLVCCNTKLSGTRVLLTLKELALLGSNRHCPQHSCLNVLLINIVVTLVATTGDFKGTWAARSHICHI